MSISVDDLVSSLSSSHIGQEAIDLATLQAQLAQTFFGQPISSSSNRPETPQGSHYSQPCNTPTTRTPSSSFSWGQMVDAQSILGSIPRRNPDAPRYDADNMMEEDERIVEDLLVPASPMSANPATSTFPTSQPFNAKFPTTPQKTSHSSFAQHQPEVQQSFFTSTDPFYMAQSQTTQNYPDSYFAQTGHPAQQSPFLVQPGYQIPHHNPSCLTLDTHSLLVTTGAAFER